MAIKNKSMYAILGILDITPSTGYDIKKYSDKVLSSFWNENYGHIYPTLKKMLEDEMIELDLQEKSDKSIRYRITEKGKREFESWLQEETAYQSLRSEFMLKLLFSSSQPKVNVIQMLENYREPQKKNIEKYYKMLENLEQDKEVSSERFCYVKAVLRRGIITAEATIQWCEETLESIRSDVDETVCDL